MISLTLGRLAEAALTKLSTSVLRGMASHCRDGDGAKEISMARRMVRLRERFPPKIASAFNHHSLMHPPPGPYSDRALGEELMLGYGIFDKR